MSTQPGYSRYDRLLSGATLRAIFRRAKVTARQARAWCLNEHLNQRAAGPIHKQPGGRALGVDPTTFSELVKKAKRKLWTTTGALAAAERAMAFMAPRRPSKPLTTEEYDTLTGPPNRKGGRSVPLWLGMGRGAGLREGSVFGSDPAPDVDVGRDGQVAYSLHIRNPRTPPRKPRYYPGDKHGDG